ncbi:MAG: hypothetical protein A2312_04760 [Candidatus Staskawiczbacteria bacterium RIFOXYB2_FULL_32_9]|uniref:Transcriptional repressor PaaX-like central Cas2-like domain-containing protein n=1 Tax=Candidatus Staskawiczbacteria bacterium RIFOXYD1_FULL_32_13 TaxID=1802234 RepID=A0A1G2JSQ6_9BACT|nr:MAG: Transcriptional regulator, PaaX family [Parcubacteria group bacterium GW2011_GWC2_32_10]OGZ79250.1 MAG: hypothetical protein A2360_02855 [Candidatus Staskawiczbacteria bacterium RIFOXYB1_FULL_32_11]OGZ81244.1 MAG: hypothetical protein A2312_04760 [Candidatus Staskawiczbacteria bacterium RIFOXYB2_FULL_32_9]OGZ85035.1 MAG: hypothetical protein A2463_04630 [Candidatus Staskawiczbacteria bacterium RIFOXYC2_FULL_32_10]OGZ89310.1 MAG: hypothetical protein A2561_02670 [Candidatus Staskawiczbac
MKYEKNISVVDILGVLVLVGVITITATSPYFLYKLAKIMLKNKDLSKYDQKKFSDIFSYAIKRGYIKVEKDGHDIKIVATEKGKRNFEAHKFAKLQIACPRKWDGKWRVVIFDIPDTQKLQRNAFRRKLKSLGFYSLQKSVWLHAFDCKKEIDILRNFFGINQKQIQVLVVQEIEGKELNKKLRDVYKV